MAKYEKNPLPKGIDDLFLQVVKMINGSTEYGLATGLKYNTAEVLKGALDDARAKQNGWLLASATLSDAFRLQRLADSVCIDFLGKAKKSITSIHGNKFAPVMVEAGFRRGSVKLPVSPAARLEMTQKLITFLAMHPECSDERPDVQVTVARAQEVYNGLEAADGAVISAQAAAETAMMARDFSEKELRRRVILLKAELRHALAPDSPVWYAYGLNAPGDKLRPEAIAGELAITPVGPGTLLVSWPAAPRATRYNVYTQLVGHDEEPLRVATVQDRTHTLEDLPAGKTLKVHVAGANAVGEGEPTPVVEVIIP